MGVYKYATSYFTYYLKGEIEVNDTTVNLKTPNTLLYFIPCGAKKRTLYLNQISSVETNFKLNGKAFFISLFLILLIATTFTDAEIRASGAIPALVVLILILLNIMLSAFTSQMIINETSGSRDLISVLVINRSVIIHASKEINTMIGKRYRNTDVNAAADKIINVINQNNPHQ